MTTDGSRRFRPYAESFADPVTTLAVRLMLSGRAGMSGLVEPMRLGADGVRRVRLDATLSLPGPPATRIHLKHEPALRMTIHRAWPDSVVSTLAGRSLSEAIALPSCGDERVDRAVAAVVVASAHVAAADRPGGGWTHLELEDAEELPVDPDGRRGTT